MRVHLQTDGRDVHDRPSAVDVTSISVAVGGVLVHIVQRNGRLELVSSSADLILSPVASNHVAVGTMPYE